MAWRHLCAAAAVVAAGSVAIGDQLQAQQPAAIRPQKPAYDDGNVEALPVAGNVYLVAGSGANIVVQVDPDGLLVIDSSVPDMADKILAAIKTFTDKPIRTIINTSADEHHTRGNEALASSGKNIYAGVGGGANREPERPQGAPIIATEFAMHRMAGLRGEPSRTNTMWPQNTFFGDRKNLYYGGEPIDILFKPAAHTDGDLIVWFRKSDVIAAGDILTTVSYPVIDAKRGGSVAGYLNALNDILDIMVPAINNQGGTMVVPGHGRICNEGDVAEIRDTMTIIRDRIQMMVDKGMTLAQVKAAKPTLDYDGVYGDPNNYIETVFAELSKAKAAAAPVRKSTQR